MQIYEQIQQGLYSDSNVILCPNISQTAVVYCHFIRTPNGSGLVSNITLPSAGKTWELSPPPLNITNTDHSIIAIGNLTVPRTYLHNNSECLPTSYYRWGFSSILLFAWCLATLLFLVILQILTWRMHEYSRSDRLEQPLSVYRDILDVAQALVAISGPGVWDDDPARIDEQVRFSGAVLDLETNSLPACRHRLWQDGVRPSTDGHGFDLSPTWYSRIARLLSSHADDDVVVHWPGKLERVIADQLPTDDKERLIRDGEGSVSVSFLSGEDVDEEAIRLQDLQMSHNGELGD